MNQYPWYWPYGLPSLMRLSNQSEAILAYSCALRSPQQIRQVTAAAVHGLVPVCTLECNTKQRHMPIEGMRLWQTDDAPAFVVLNPHASVDFLRSSIALVYQRRVLPWQGKDRAVNNNIDRPTQTTWQESKRYSVTPCVTLFSLFGLLVTRFPVLTAETFPDQRSPNVSGSINITRLSDVREPFKIIIGDEHGIRRYRLGRDRGRTAYNTWLHILLRLLDAGARG